MPQRAKKSVNIAADFLWGDTGYVLGADSKGDVARSAAKFAEFKRHLGAVAGDLEDEGYAAVAKFIDGWEPDRAAELPHWEEMVDTNVVFQLDGERRFVHERAAVSRAWLAYLERDEDTADGWCLVTGARSPLARLHPAIHGVRGAQSSGGNIVSFNLDAFTSFGKVQGDNAPISLGACAAYSTALNYLLRRGSGQCILVGDATTVFWAEKPSRLERGLHYLFNPQELDEGTTLDPTTVQEIRVFLDAVRQGRAAALNPEEDVAFYILGLSPNVSRLSVRFWYAGSVGEVVGRLGRHFADISIETQFPRDQAHPPLWQLLCQVAVRGKSENVPPLLGGAMMRSILTASRYPESLLAQVLLRARAEKGEINHQRAMLIKGCLVRNHNQEVSMSLDENKKDVPYLLGRLFAAFEKAQVDASGGSLNTTIRDRYFGSASATPRAVFPVLFRLNQHHVSKGQHGGYYAKLIGEIVEHVPADNLPTHMRLEDQGLFAIGYYHQRNAFYRKHESAAAPQQN
jgi:CRISPR-associated protein Csd1